MKKSQSARRLLLPEGPTTTLSQPSLGDQLAVRCDSTGLLLPAQPLLGYARTPDGLCLYVPGHTAAKLRTAAEHAPAFVQEVFFGDAPTHLTEVVVDDYAAGDLVFFPTAAQLTLRLAA
ncbi:hypothetical protein [Solirubrum puertoriconensis]|uniref:Uncharacterized protein n=1 Tax=Solirubrum puertoriconensis TaxID=1751427 RepID=A0A9X0L3U3_SOLP1|nr:hypothetical protein [Solirubrum puertoriconensis]KUG06908.1 hypothetical protein ASU33_06175 [Solirubrum puertoriconensis]